MHDDKWRPDNTRNDARRLAEHKGWKEAESLTRSNRGSRRRRGKKIKSEKWKHGYRRDFLIELLATALCRHY